MGRSVSIYLDDVALAGIGFIRNYYQRRLILNPSDSELVAASILAYQGLIANMERKIPLCPNPTCTSKVEVGDESCSKCGMALLWVPLARY